MKIIRFRRVPRHRVSPRHGGAKFFLINLYFSFMIRCGGAPPGAAAFIVNSNETGIFLSYVYIDTLKVPLFLQPKLSPKKNV